jgi:hypothetical protein
MAGNLPYRPIRCAFNKNVTYFFTLYQFIFNKHYSMDILTRRRKQLGIGLLKFLAGDTESPLQVFRCGKRLA